MSRPTPSNDDEQQEQQQQQQQQQDQRRKPTILISGAGLVGSLSASMLSQRGYHIILLESRSDPRIPTRAGKGFGRSINLALSHRGIESLKSVDSDLAQRVQKEGLGMRGRMIHKKGSSAKGEVVEKEGQDYGLPGEEILSISRNLLGNYLLDHLEQKRTEIDIRFETKLLELDLRSPHGGVEVVLGSKDKGEERLKVDWVIGGDGAYSRVRREMMRGANTRFNYQQSYAPHAYLELSIPPSPDHTWSIENNYLHIWPRGEFMLIALPNQDKSFTLTLFAYQSTFDSIDQQLRTKHFSDHDRSNPVVKLFRDEFPDALELMGEERLMKCWNENPKDGLITIECSPYHYKDKALLIGDAAHAMVPFYGQGMNCAFEDVKFLSTLLDHYSACPQPSPSPLPLPYSSNRPHFPEPIEGLSNLENALKAYTELRSPSLKAIQSLAAQNYEEMASSVLSPFYQLRLSLDSFISNLFGLLPIDQEEEALGRGKKWESLYRMTTFRYGLAYEEVLKRRKWQAKVLEWSLSFVALGFMGVGLEIVRRFNGGSLGRLKWVR